MRSLSI